MKTPHETYEILKVNRVFPEQQQKIVDKANTMLRDIKQMCLDNDIYVSLHAEYREEKDFK